MATASLSLEPKHVDFLLAQKMFFVATAPLAANGHVNVSPKGLDSLRVLSPTRVAYLDLVGSGIETVAHVRENGRIVLMACAFEGPPNILRIYGTGEVLLPEQAGWNDAAALFPEYRSARSIVTINIARVTNSCGFGVPLYEFGSERPQLGAWAHRKTPEELERYKADKNRVSVDGLPGLPPTSDA